MANVPYYMGDTVPLRFKIVNEFGPVKAEASEIIIYTPDNSRIDNIDAVIADDLISYIVPTTVTSLAGSYTVFFTNTFAGGMIRTHKMHFTIAEKPVSI